MGPDAALRLSQVCLIRQVAHHFADLCRTKQERLWHADDSFQMPTQFFGPNMSCEISFKSQNFKQFPKIGLGWFSLSLDGHQVNRPCHARVSMVDPRFGVGLQYNDFAHGAFPPKRFHVTCLENHHSQYQSIYDVPLLRLRLESHGFTGLYPLARL